MFIFSIIYIIYIVSQKFLIYNGLNLSEIYVYDFNLYCNLTIINLSLNNLLFIINYLKNFFICVCIKFIIIHILKIIVFFVSFAII